MNKKQEFLLNPKIWIVICLTLGLAPFTPEPHIWEKLKWIANGANGMQAIDWFDVLLHGTPWILLAVSLTYKLKISKND
ncbi:MAG: hypothetical protein ACR2PU_02360 [Gammaproteobacteria bacterium]